MNAQQIIDNADTFKFNPRQFRKEMNIAWLISDAIKAHNALNVKRDLG